MLGLIINWPQILPIRIIPTGPPQGISDIIRAADAALAAITSGSCFPSEERTLAITYTDGGLGNIIDHWRRMCQKGTIKQYFNSPFRRHIEGQ